MKTKSERTLEDYKTAGAYLRLFKYVYHLGWEYLQPVMPRAQWDRWHNIGDKILANIQNELENRMFREHAKEECPDEDFIRVFYGSELSATPLHKERAYQEQALYIVQKEIVDRLGLNTEKNHEKMASCERGY